MARKDKKQQWKERIREGETHKLFTNPFFALLVKYNGELFDATPNEISIATKKCGTEGKAKRKRREAINKYNREYDKNGVKIVYETRKY